MGKLAVIEVDGIFVVDSRLIAERLDIDHKSFIKTVRKYQTKVEQRFGQIRFEINTVTNSVKAVNEVKFAFLRKHQVIPKDKQYRFNFNSDKIVAMKRA